MNANPPSLLSRRAMLQSTSAGFGWLAFSAMSTWAAQDSGAAARNPLAPRQPHFPATAKRIIFLFMKGGPSQVDTFDPKPLLDRDNGKPPPFELPRVKFAQTGNLLRSPWAFKNYGQSGLPVSDLFPHVGQCADDLCVIRSMYGSNPAHGGALLKLHTGSDVSVRPSMGAWVTYGLGTENSDLPAFITICPTLAHGGVNNWGSAFLPAWTQGTPIGNASIPADKAVVKHISRRGMTADMQRRQLDLLGDLNHDFNRAAGDHGALEARIDSFELAYRMQSTMPGLQDISGESEATRRLYGLDDPVTRNFGLQCLMARRFCERGVRFVQVTHSDAFVQWDQHSDLLKGHSKNAAEVDKPISGLLRDLKARGLLEDTLVMWGGEFGRTPVAQGANGRDHNPHGFTLWMAGGGVKGGHAHGATDDYGYYAQEDKVHINDLHATMLHLLGLNHERLTYQYAGRAYKLTDLAGQVVKGIIA